MVRAESGNVVGRRFYFVAKLGQHGYYMPALITAIGENILLHTITERLSVFIDQVSFIVLIIGSQLLDT